MERRRQRVRRLAGKGFAAEFVPRRTTFTAEEVQAIWDEDLAYEDEWQRGYDEGLEMVRTEMIVRLASEGIDVNAIARYVDVSVDEVKRVLESPA